MEKNQPKRLGHLVLKVRDIHASVKFYTEIVGLVVSDWIEENMVFMRVPGGHDHHDLGLFQLPDPPARDRDADPMAHAGLEHLSYEVEDYSHIEKAVRILQAHDVKIVRGPGKHGPGENVFLVFEDPDGHYVEFYCEMVQITEDNPYEASVWEDNLDAFDQWHFEKFAVEPPPLYLERLKKEGATPRKTKVGTPSGETE